MDDVLEKTIEFADRKLSFQIGRLAKQATVSVLGQYGDTVVLATVVSAPLKEEVDYFPLHVEYREKYYAGGRISSSRFVKRERRPRTDEVLTARMIDRSIRPLFPKDYREEVQVILTVLSYDEKANPGLVGLLATSTALAVSPIPWEGPVGGVQIGLDRSGNFILNPATEEAEEGPLDLTVVTCKGKVVMLEGKAREIEREKMLAAIQFAQREGEKIEEFINQIEEEIGSKKEYQPQVYPKELILKIKKELEKDKKKIFKRLAEGKEEIALLREEFGEKLSESYTKKEINSVFFEQLRKMVRERILQGERIDGRKPEEIRELAVEVGVLPRTHGSAIFKRGETQVLSVVTLGAPSLEQWIETLEGEEKKSFIHHYNMPPFATGEVGKLGWPSRREIGHGALAEKALKAVIPKKEKFPYMIRVVSEVLSSNGSTSMASVCGSSLALMDAGVPVSAPVGGIALGLVSEKDKKVILTDITGLEDGFGDMDFKVAGTLKGITALQLDVKIPGLSLDLIEEIFARAYKAREEILGVMQKVLPAPRASLSPYAPKIEVLKVDPKMIGEIIGPGGKVIRDIIAKTETGIDIEEDGTVTVSGETKEAVRKAVDWIRRITRVVKVGEEFVGEVVRIEPYGAFVQIAPGKEGLVHISQMPTKFVRDVSRIVKIGQKVKVKVLGIDEMGRIKLTMKLGHHFRPSRFRRQF